jgi:membrane-bound lytic murein transglycosylase B
MTGAWRVMLRWTIGWSVASAAALALGPADAEDSHPIQPAPLAQKAQAPVQIAQAQTYGITYPQAQSPFERYKAYLAAKARSQGVRESTIQAVIPTLHLNSRVMELDRAQRPTPTNDDRPPSFAGYLQRHITSSLINRGQSRYSTHWGNLSRIEQRYGVDPAVIMAIYGKETSYGSITGGFDLLEVLASLAYEGRRRSLFENEFVATLKLMDAGVRRYQLKGSYAGATGYPQFLPSVVLRLRQDGNGDGYADVWGSEDDAFASIANYLRDAGWKRGIPWGVPVNIPARLNRAAIQSRVHATRCPAVFKRHSRWLTVAEWRTLGIVPGGRGLPENELATLMETPGAYAPGYLLTRNYYAILDYNCSNYYALSVALLANAISAR